jgi:hypothetical protein
MNENKTVKKIFFSRVQIWIAGIALAFVMAFSVFVTYQLVAPPSGFGITDSGYYDYSVVFYNVKCMATDQNLGEKEILAGLYDMGITKKKAVEIFTEAKLGLQNDIDEKSTINRCRNETAQYYDTALNLLKNLDRIKYKLQ